MSYLEEVRQMVEDRREEEVNKYKQFVEDFIVPDLATSETGNSLFNKDELVQQSIHVEPFIYWLKEEGFIVSEGIEDIFTVMLG